MNGVSTRAVDDLVQALGIGSGISKSEVSRICAGLDEQVAAFRTRTLHHTTFPYVFLDATYLHVRRSGQVSSMAVVVATGVTATGGRERSSASTSATPRTRCFGAGSCAPSANGACPGCGSSSPTNTPAWSPPYGASSRAWHINARSSAW